MYGEKTHLSFSIVGISGKQGDYVDSNSRFYASKCQHSIGFLRARWRKEFCSRAANTLRGKYNEKSFAQRHSVQQDLDVWAEFVRMLASLAPGFIAETCQAEKQVRVPV